MPPCLKRLLLAGALLALAGPTSSHAAPMGTVEGHLTIVGPREVELADGSAPSPAVYSKYPLVIRGRDGKETTRVTADGKGNYRVALPAGEYLLDVQGRARGHVRAKAEPFTVQSNRTVWVNLTIDTGVR